MNYTNTQALEEAAGLIHEALGLLKDYRNLAAACQVILEEIDKAVDDEDERSQQEE